MRKSKTRLEAVKQAGASNKRQAIEQEAVRELVENRKRKALADLIGTGVFAVSEAEFQKRRSKKHARAK